MHTYIDLGPFLLDSLELGKQIQVVFLDLGIALVFVEEKGTGLLIIESFQIILGALISIMKIFELVIHELLNLILVFGV